MLHPLVLKNHKEYPKSFNKFSVEVWILIIKDVILREIVSHSHQYESESLSMVLFGISNFVIDSIFSRFMKPFESVFFFSCRRHI